MPKCERWIVAQKMVVVIDANILKEILDLGGQVGGGWCLVHQHIHVNPDNKEQIEKLLTEKGFDVAAVSSCRHPENEEGR
jgi:translation initiation factor 1 (eIF-1/SUI1)